MVILNDIVVPLFKFSCKPSVIFYRVGTRAYAYTRVYARGRVRVYFEIYFAKKVEWNV